LSALEGKLLWRFTSGSRYERRIWRCNRKYDPAGDQPCATKHVTEDELIAAFEQATRQLAPPPSPEVLEAALDQLGDLHELEAKRAAITAFHQYRSENPAISYTPEAWRALVDHAAIHPDGTIAIAFNDG